MLIINAVAVCLLPDFLEKTKHRFLTSENSEHNLLSTPLVLLTCRSCDLAFCSCLLGLDHSLPAKKKKERKSGDHSAHYIHFSSLSDHCDRTHRIICLILKSITEPPPKCVQSTGQTLRRCCICTVRCWYCPSRCR